MSDLMAMRWTRKTTAALLLFRPLHYRISLLQAASSFLVQQSKVSPTKMWNPNCLQSERRRLFVAVMSKTIRVVALARTYYADADLNDVLMIMS